MILNITPPTSGSIVFRGRDLSTIRGGADRTAFMAAVQPIFQNPFEAFNPLKRLDHYLHVTARRFTGARRRRPWSSGPTRPCGRSACRSPRSGGASRTSSRAASCSASRSPGRSSRGPPLIVADEPVSMVDASLRMAIVNLFRALRDDLGISIVYITHDLATAYYISDSS